MLEYLNLKGMFYYTLRCQIEDNVPHRNVWLRTFVNWYHVVTCIRYLFANFCMFTSKQTLLQYDVLYFVIVQYVCIDNYIMVCFSLLALFTISLTRMLPKVNRSPNGDFLNELVVLNVKDFTANNPTIRSFQMWPFRFCWQKIKSKFNKNPDFEQIQLKNIFKHFELLSRKSRIKMLVFISCCEILSGLLKFVFGLLVYFDI